MPPDSSGKVKKRKKVFPFNNLASLNLDFTEKKLLKKVKKGKKQIMATTHSLKFADSF